MDRGKCARAIICEQYPESAILRLKTHRWMFLNLLANLEIHRGYRPPCDLFGVTLFSGRKLHALRNFSAENQREKQKHYCCAVLTREQTEKPKWKSQRTPKRLLFFREQMEIRTNGNLEPNSLSQKRKWNSICSRAYCILVGTPYALRFCIT